MSTTARDDGGDIRALRELGVGLMRVRGIVVLGKKECR